MSSTAVGHQAFTAEHKADKIVDLTEKTNFSGSGKGFDGLINFSFQAKCADLQQELIKSVPPSGKVALDRTVCENEAAST